MNWRCSQHQRYLIFGPGQLNVDGSVLHVAFEQEEPLLRAIMIPGTEAGGSENRVHWEAGFLSPVLRQQAFLSFRNWKAFLKCYSSRATFAARSFLAYLSKIGRQRACGERVSEQLIRPAVSFHPCSSVSMHTGPDQDAFFNVTVTAQVLMQMDWQSPLISSAQNSSQIFLVRESEGHITILAEEILIKS